MIEKSKELQTKRRPFNEKYALSNKGSADDSYIDQQWGFLDTLSQESLHHMRTLIKQESEQLGLLTSIPNLTNKLSKRINQKPFLPGDEVSSSEEDEFDNPLDYMGREKSQTIVGERQRLSSLMKKDVNSLKSSMITVEAINTPLPRYSSNDTPLNLRLSSYAPRPTILKPQDVITVVETEDTPLLQKRVTLARPRPTTFKPRDSKIVLDNKLKLEIKHSTNPFVK